MSRFLITDDRPAGQRVSIREGNYILDLPPLRTAAVVGQAFDLIAFPLRSAAGGAVLRGWSVRRRVFHEVDMSLGGSAK